MDAMNQRLKEQIVENLILEMQPTDILDDQPFFEPQGLGLDSVDALQLVVMLDKHYGVKIEDAEVARNVLHSVQTIAEYIRKNGKGVHLE